ICFILVDGASLGLVNRLVDHRCWHFRFNRVGYWWQEWIGDGLDLLNRRWHFPVNHVSYWRQGGISYLDRGVGRDSDFFLHLVRYGRQMRIGDPFGLVNDICYIINNSVSYW